MSEFVPTAGDKIKLSEDMVPVRTLGLSYEDYLKTANAINLSESALISAGDFYLNNPAQRFLYILNNLQKLSDNGYIFNYFRTKAIGYVDKFLLETIKEGDPQKRKEANKWLKQIREIRKSEKERFGKMVGNKSVRQHIREHFEEQLPGEISGMTEGKGEGETFSVSPQSGSE